MTREPTRFQTAAILAFLAIGVSTTVFGIVAGFTYAILWCLNHVSIVIK